jgi:hypothetical protein
MIQNKIEKLLSEDKNIQYILLDRESFLDLKESLGIPMYNQLTKYLGVFLYSLEVPYYLLQPGYEDITERK